MLILLPHFLGYGEATLQFSRLLAYCVPNDDTRSVSHRNTARGCCMIVGYANAKCYQEFLFVTQVAVALNNFCDCSS